MEERTSASFSFLASIICLILCQSPGKVKVSTSRGDKASARTTCAADILMSHEGQTEPRRQELRGGHLQNINWKEDRVCVHTVYSTVPVPVQCLTLCNICHNYEVCLDLIMTYYRNKFNVFCYSFVWLLRSTSFLSLFKHVDACYITLHYITLHYITLIYKI